MCLMECRSVRDAMLMSSYEDRDEILFGYLRAGTADVHSGNREIDFASVSTYSSRYFH